MILLRHGQSEFNLHFTATRKDPGIIDARLTDLGHEQAEAAALALADQPISRIIVSPFTRTLQTAVPAARALRAPIIVNPLVRERCAFACDIGTPRTELGFAWPGIDFRHLEEVWWPPMPEPAADVIDRAGRFRAEMAVLPDWSETLVVTHWGFIMALTGLSVQNGTWMRYDPTQPAPDEISWRPPAPTPHPPR